MVGFPGWLAVTALLCGSSFAQDSWTAVQQLKTGSRIGVVQTDGKRLEGRFAGATSTEVALATGETVPKDRVMRVYENPRVSRGWRTVIGAGAGAAVGLVVDQTLGTRFRNEGQDPAGAIYGASIAGGAAIGALSGGGYQTVYRRP